MLSNYYHCLFSSQALVTKQEWNGDIHLADEGARVYYLLSNYTFDSFCKVLLFCLPKAVLKIIIRLYEFAYTQNFLAVQGEKYQVTSFIIKCRYNALSDRLKERALSEYRVQSTVS